MAKKLTDKEITSYRSGVDKLDEEIVALFEKRMNLTKDLSDYKLAHNISIYDPDREKEITDTATSRVIPELASEVTLLMRTLMALGRGYQRRLMFTRAPAAFLPAPQAPKTKDVHVAYQGSVGAWGEQAARKLFPKAEFSSVPYFEDVFKQVKDGKVDYGVLPIENSKTGAIGETYDLLRTYGCYIVARTWLDIRHCLLAKKGASLKDIREVYSHPQGFQQCRRFLDKQSWDLVATSNTAVAAEKVAATADNHAAAIGSRLAAEHNGLEILAEDIMDSDKNRTSFVVIANHPEYDSKSNLVSFSFATTHVAGSLCEALLPFTAAGVNLTRIESRPSASPSTYRFFAEIDGNILDSKVQETLGHAAGVTEYFEVIGCYKSV